MVGGNGGMAGIADFLSLDRKRLNHEVNRINSYCSYDYVIAIIFLKNYFHNLYLIFLSLYIYIC